MALPVLHVPPGAQRLDRPHVVQTRDVVRRRHAPPHPARLPPHLYRALLVVVVAHRDDACARRSNRCATVVVGSWRVSVSIAFYIRAGVWLPRGCVHFSFCTGSVGDRASWSRLRGAFRVQNCGWALLFGENRRRERRGRAREAGGEEGEGSRGRVEEDEEEDEEGGDEEEEREREEEGPPLAVR
jgi:hypothetical protein